MSRPELVSSSALDLETSADAPPSQRGRRVWAVAAAVAVVAGAAVAGPRLIHLPGSEAEVAPSASASPTTSREPRKDHHSIYGTASTWQGSLLARDVVFTAPGASAGQLTEVEVHGLLINRRPEPVRLLPSAGKVELLRDGEPVPFLELAAGEQLAVGDRGPSIKGAKVRLLGVRDVLRGDRLLVRLPLQEQGKAMMAPLDGRVVVPGAAALPVSVTVTVRGAKATRFEGEKVSPDLLGHPVQKVAVQADLVNSGDPVTVISVSGPALVEGIAGLVTPAQADASDVFSYEDLVLKKGSTRLAVKRGTEESAPMLITYLPTGPKDQGPYEMHLLLSNGTIVPFTLEASGT